VAIGGIVCDLDGVVYRGEEPIAGAADALARLRSEGARVVFCTNNSTATVRQYEVKLRRMGIDASERDIVTSAVVTGETLARDGFEGRRALVVGGPGLRESVIDARVAIEDDPAATTADVVVVGLDTAFTYDAMRRATIALRAGAAFIATNTDATFPAPDGVLWPGAGAIVASLARASGREPEVMGKPHAPMLAAVERRLGAACDIAIIGDRPDTDLAGGAARGWKTVLVLSGVTPPTEAGSVHPRPDLVLESLAELSLRDL
jgi:4-nitrophenyl phosphatase